MLAVQEWAIVLCLTGGISCFVEMLTIKGKTAKVVNFVLGAFMICALILPVSKISFNNLWNSNNLAHETSSEITQDIQNKTKEEFVNLTCNKITSLAEEILRNNSIKFKKVSTYMDINADYSISIIKITVEIEKEFLNKKDKIKTLLESELGIQTDVVCS